MTWEELASKSVPEPNSGCLLWLGATADTGYASIGRGGKRHYGHRLAYEMKKGPIPAGCLVMHTCDNRLCLNPDHLALGTDHKNAIDKEIKGRGKGRGLMPYGVARQNSKRECYVAQVQWKGKRYHLGTYNSIEDAHRIALEFRDRLWRETYPELMK